MSVGIDSSLLLSYYQRRSGAAPTADGVAPGGSVGKKVAPTAPWSGLAQPADPTAAVKSALLGRRLINENGAKLDLAGASQDYRKLFALYQGLDTLSQLSERISAKGLTDVDRAQIQRVFTRGLQETTTYLAGLKLDQLRLTQGVVAASAKTTIPLVKSKPDYVTAPLTDSTDAEAPAFLGDVRFTISINRLGVNHDVDIDLAGMGGAPRTIGAVMDFINGRLAAAGVATRFATQRTPGQPKTIQAGGQTITLPAAADQWGFRVKADSTETVSFSAPATAGAVYLAQSVGNPDPDGKASTNDSRAAQQFLKFQTDNNNVSAPTQPSGAANWVEGRVFANQLGPEVKAIRAQKVAADGSVYMLAEITAKTAGQEIRGDQDVALLKYDSVGNLIFSRTLGASDTASGLALAIADDGRVAIAGSVKGQLSGATEGPLNSGASGAFADQADSFVTVFDGEGQELWTQRRGARQADEANGLAFGNDGQVYVVGRARSAIPGAAAIGDWDGYIQGFKQGADGKVQTLFAQSFGTAGADRPAGLVVDGDSLITAANEQGRAVLRRYDLSGGTPAQVAMRDLGDLQGGDLIGLELGAGGLVVAGNTANGSLDAGVVTRANAGGVDAFAAVLSASLAPGASDSVAYYGGAGADRASALAVAGGAVWLSGSAGADLPGQPPVGTRDGFLAQLDVSAGAVVWSRRFSGKDGYAAPGAIAVDAAGASVLDRLGLPSGELQKTDSQRITAVSAVRPGDTFTIQVGGGGAARSVVIDGADTLDTLALKIRRASGFQAKVTLLTVNGTRSLRIEPQNDRSVLTLAPGKPGADALASLGIPPGVIRSTITGDDGKVEPADGKGPFYGLGLDSNLSLEAGGDINHARAELQTAMGVIRTAYKDLVAAATPKSVGAEAAKAAGGPVPAYLTNQIANYQAALDRLTGGG